MAFKIIKCPFCQRPIGLNPEQNNSTVICPECQCEFNLDGKFSIMVQPTAFINHSSPKANHQGQDFIGDWRFCRNCGTKLSANAYSCPQCGEPTSLAFQQQKTVCDDDYLGGGWIAGIWLCALFIPFGWVIVIILSSILYWSWRRDFPRKASAINLHGWCSIIVSIILSFWLGLTFLSLLARLFSL